MLACPLSSHAGIREDACQARARLGTADPEQVEAWLGEIEEAYAAGNLLRASWLGVKGPLTRSWVTGGGLARPSMCKGPGAHECGAAEAPLPPSNVTSGGGGSAGVEEDAAEVGAGLQQTLTCEYSLFAYPAADNVNGAQAAKGFPRGSLLSRWQQQQEGVRRK